MEKEDSLIKIVKIYVFFYIRSIYGSTMKMKMAIFGLTTMIGSSEFCRGPFLNAFGKAKTMA